MSITFSITNQPAAVPGQELAHSFEEGGTIGRTRTCDWVLIDASRFISGKHAVISEQNGVYQITDTSTNGVFINDSKTPLGKGNSATLKTGDILKIGEYVINVSINGQQAQVATPQEYDFFSPPPSAPGDKIVAEGLREGPVDPLELFSTPEKSEPVKPTPTPMESGFIPQPPKEPSYKSTQANNVQPVHQHFTPPNIIPDNWLDEEEKAKAAEQMASFQPPSPPTREDLQFTPPKPTPTTSAAAMQQPAAIPELTNGTTPPVIKKKRVKKAARPTGMTSGPGNQTIQAFLTGLGVPDLNIPPDQAAGFMRTVGEVMRECLAGTFNVLRSRMNIKSEFRMSMTTIQAVENNPLKFSVNLEEAIRNMFAAKSSSYLPPVEAIHEGFEDIEGHQLAVMAGTQAAIVALLRRFKPDELAEEFDHKAGRGGILAGGKKAKYWDAYEEFYAELAASVEDNFQNMFGDEFARAYENQVQRLLGSRRKPK